MRRRARRWSEGPHGRPSWPVRLLLGREALAPILRFSLLAGLLGAWWVSLALTVGRPVGPPPESIARAPFPFDALLLTTGMFFSPRVLAHLLPALFGLWLGFRVAAAYLADVFDLGDSRAAARYLWPALFGLDVLAYPRLDVDAGDLDLLERANPLLAVGGPGTLRIHLGYAAVLEDEHGRPRVLGPAALEFLRGFERVRDVVDLRHQAARVDAVRARTREGIEVQARDVQMVFHVFRGEGRPRALDDPFPFDEASVRRLVYSLPVGEDGRARWVDELPGLVTREIQRFVERLTVEEFLALRPEPGAESGLRSFAIPREQLTARFHTPEVAARLRALGLALEWVGVGAWEIGQAPAGGPAAPGVGQTLITAWRERERLAQYTSPDYLARQSARGFREAAAGMLLEWVGVWRGDRAGQDAQAACLQLLTHVQSDLEGLRQELRADPERRLPAGFDDALAHLERLTTPHTLGRGKA